VVAVVGEDANRGIENELALVPRCD
jgi:hypothetical protein